ncbi:MAG: hypothetical protein WC827_05000 [Candidatus Paceibacterota bacterium]
MNKKNKIVMFLIIFVGISFYLIITRLDKQYSVAMWILGIIIGGLIERLKE